MRPTSRRAARRTIVWAASGFLAACLCAFPVLAQAEHPRIAKVSIVNNHLLPADQIEGALGVKAGQPLDTAQLDGAIERWNKEGLYGTLSYRAEPAPNGEIELVVSISERIALTGVVFQGNEEFSSLRLEQLTGLMPGTRASEADVADAERRIAAAYRDSGFAGTQVHGRLVMAGAERRELVFQIREAPRAWVEAIEFEGNEHVPSGELKDVMQSSTRGWLSWVWPGWFHEDTFREDVNRVQAAYRDRGYLDAEVKGDAVFGPDMRRAVLRLTVEEGEVYRVKEVTFEGNTIFLDSELLAATPVVVGGAYRPGSLAAAVDAISRLYADQGYWDVTPAKGNLRAEEVLPPKGTEVSVAFHIIEGEAVYIHRIEVTGLTKTKESVVRRGLTFYPQQRALASEFRASEEALANTGYFDPEVRQPVTISLAPQEGALRDAIVNVQEGATGRVMLSGGVGSDSGLLAGIMIEEDNFDISNWPSSWSDLWEHNAFRGAGQRLSIVLQAGTERSFYAISWENPAVSDSQYGVGAALYSKGITRNEFDETRTGASVSVSQHPSASVQRTLTLGYESINVDNIPAGSPPELLNAKGTHSKPFVRLGASVDRRDSRFLPTRGYQLGAEVELAAGDAHAIKVTGQAEKYWTVHEDRGRHQQVLGVRGRAGVVQAYSGDVPVYERFYAGGFTSLRGFAFEGVSPAVAGKRVGGDSMLVGSVEYSLPVTEDDRLRLLTFCDAGYVKESAGAVLTGWDELRLSLGVGVRWQAPFLGPATVEVDLAAPVLKQSGDDTQILSFSVGAERRF